MGFSDCLLFARTYQEDRGQPGKLNAGNEKATIVDRGILVA